MIARTMPYFTGIEHDGAVLGSFTYSPFTILVSFTILVVLSQNVQEAWHNISYYIICHLYICMYVKVQAGVNAQEGFH